MYGFCLVLAATLTTADLAADDRGTSQHLDSDGRDGKSVDAPMWNDDRFRSIDDSVATLVRQLLVAVGGLFVAFIATELIRSHLLRSIHGSAEMVLAGAILAACGSMSMYVTSARPIRAAIALQRQVIAASEQRLLNDAERHRFSTQLQDAFEMVGTELEALDVVGRALGTINDRPGELLLADSSRAHLRRAAVSATGGQAGCLVESPWQCPAVRRGQTMRFFVDDDLASCPKLRQRGTGCSAVCTPVTVLGTPMGVLHIVGDAGVLPGAAAVTKLETLASQAGSRIGMLRAITSSELQAATDPLTGAANRRSLEERLHHLTNDRAAYTVVLADLDHFKQINDTHGHTTGDQALRLFVDVLRRTVREQDMVVRYGGEEFVIVLPGISRGGAIEVIDRVRLALTSALDGHEVPRFSASFGIADSTQADAPERVVTLADLAMLHAKSTGRDRVVIAGDAPDGPAAERVPSIDRAHLPAT